MLSTPLTLIEGAFALPCVRPHDHLPEPFGREWALLPLGQRWRAGLDSLYAALLRTVCMSDQHLLSYGQWVSIDGVLPGAQQKAAAQSVEIAAQSIGEPANTAAAARRVAQRRMPQGPMRIALKARTPRIAQRRSVWTRRRVAASAGAIGCAAVLAWWMVDQPVAPRRVASDTLKSVQASMARRDVPVEKRRSQHQVARPDAPVVAEAFTPAPALPPLPAAVAAAAPTPSEQIHSHPPHRVVRAQTRPQRAHRYAAHESSHEARLGADEYADLTTSSMTMLRDVTPPPRLVVSNNLPANRTEWMNHMSQRRVTEIPEQFAR